MDTMRDLTIKVKELTEVVHGLRQEVLEMRKAMMGNQDTLAGELWTMKDVMEFGHCGRTYIWKMLRQRNVFTKARKDGGRWLFDPEQVRSHFRGGIAKV